ncbi:MAG TPA: ABC transporter permease, partial [Vicinamibacteria bacterium]|nr:ABC transporter permease [Vicinamibacteria bacterium]
MPTVARVASLLLLTGGMAVAYPDFATGANAEVVAMGFVLEAFMALGMTLVIVTGGIDLSVGAVLPFAAILTASMLRAGVSAPTAALVALVAAAGIGLINAGLALGLRVHPFIVTLGTMLSLKGLNLVLTGGGPVGGLPPGFAWIGQGHALGLPIPLLLFAVLAATLAVLMRTHRFWQQAYLIGGNPRAARTSGVRVGRVLAVVYVLSAVLAALAGVIAASSHGSASAGFGQNAELRVITAVVIGGASLQGGTGSIGGTVLGLCFLAVLYNAFAMTGVSTYWQDVVTGVLVLASALATELVTRRRA